MVAGEVEEEESEAVEEAGEAEGIKEGSKEGNRAEGETEASARFLSPRETRAGEMAPAAGAAGGGIRSGTLLRYPEGIGIDTTWSPIQTCVACL